MLQENLTGIRVVRAFARDEHEIERFAKCNQAFRDHLYRLNKLEAMYWGISDFVSLGQISVVVIAAGIFLAQGTISVGELFAFLTLVSMAIWPVRRLGHVLAGQRQGGDFAQAHQPHPGGRGGAAEPQPCHSPLG